MRAGALQVLPLNVRASPLMSTATQSEADRHETDVTDASASMRLGALQVLPLNLVS
jgi:hypothetical protein